MHGNVDEWVEDNWYKYYIGTPVDGSAWIKYPRDVIRVIRGGGWSASARFCRSASRNRYMHEIRDNRLGFRLSRSVSDKPMKTIK